MNYSIIRNKKKLKNKKLESLRKLSRIIQTKTLLIKIKGLRCLIPKII